ncbi:MAG: enoyl-CoA hydratase/isomerase family protein [Acidimicrobiales bacterium]|nr:enoyl-CoA hydratase/isomerase family protein [Acidimicrobiales bacterium]
MSAPTLTQDGELFVVSFGDDLNTTDRGWVSAMNEILDEVEAATGPKVLLTTGAGKHYSNGLDVEWMAGKPSEDIVVYVNSVERVLARILTFPAPTVAAVNGHAFGAGAFAVLAHDHVVMREDRGFVCWPEVHLGMTFSRGLLAMIQDLLVSPVARDAIVTGHRYTAAEAVAAGFVDRSVPLDRLMTAAAELGLPLAATAESSVGRIKQQLHRRVVDALGSA